MDRKLVHVGIAVKSLADSVSVYKKLFPQDDVRIEDVADQRVKVAFFRTGACSVELTEATDPQSPIGKFIARRGEGVHHLSFEVDDLQAELDRLRGEGFRLIDEQPRMGAGGYRIAFLHPASTSGVLIELSEKAAKG